MPEFLYDIRHPNATLSEHLDGPHYDTQLLTTTTIPTTTKCTCPQINSSKSGNLEFLHSMSNHGSVNTIS